MHDDYIKKTHKTGRITTLIAILLMILVPTVITVANAAEVNVDIGKTISGIVSLSVVFLPLAITEVISYSPILGAGGSYLSFITGNVMNMKLPAATNALNGANVERGSDEAEIISTLAIGASTLVTTLVLFLGMLFLGKLLVPIISKPEFSPAFGNIMPALLGALAVPMFLKNIKLAIVPILLGIVMYLVIGQTGMLTLSNYVMLPFIIVTIGIFLIFYKVGIIKEKP